MKTLPGLLVFLIILSNGLFFTKPTYTLSAEKAGIGKKSKLRDLWLHQNAGKIGSEKAFTIPKHGIIVLKKIET